MSALATILFIVAGLLLAWQVVICAVAWGEVKDALKMRELGMPYRSKVSVTAVPLLLALLLALVGALVK